MLLVGTPKSKTTEEPAGGKAHRGDEDAEAASCISPL